MQSGPHYHLQTGAARQTNHTVPKVVLHILPLPVLVSASHTFLYREINPTKPKIMLNL